MHPVLISGLAFPFITIAGLYFVVHADRTTLLLLTAWATFFGAFVSWAYSRYIAQAYMSEWAARKHHHSHKQEQSATVEDVCDRSGVDGDWRIKMRDSNSSGSGNASKQNDARCPSQRVIPRLAPMFPFLVSMVYTFLACVLVALAVLFAVL